MAPAFLDALVAGAAGEAEGKLWEGVLRDCFAALKGFDFAAPEKHAGALRRWVALAGCWLRMCTGVVLW